MDFIKTSSLRALIELTFQRNWNGLIWMSRKGVTTKRVKTVQTALSRISAQTAQSGWPRNVFHARPNIRPSEVSAKVQTIRPTHTTREQCPAVGQATTTPRHAARAGKQASRPRTTYLAYHGRCAVRAGKHVPRPAEKASANLHPSDHSGRPRIHPATTVPIVDHGHTRSSGRSSRPTVRTPRSTRSPF
ncbi:unnamed protein product [Microthlaspi erraticum]|uniref:Uncharacterized protein n=1 Tax=Microthlaspi erraticum TaxID=1685480 RepID=A0A6D2IYV9_9BRAS|nr:unnamed protein product [Microthlaspi erraticum]